jgi:hypothetical protein
MVGVAEGAISAADAIAVSARRHAPTIQPACLNLSRALSPWPALVGPGEVAGGADGPWPANAMHVGFFDNRRNTNVELFGRVIELARRVETSSAPIVPHALLFSRPRDALPPGFVLHLLTPFAEKEGSATLAQCLFEGLRRLCHGPGANYVWKPLIHLLLPPSVDRLLLLDTDVIIIRPLSQLLAAFHDFGPEAVVGIGPEQSNLYERTSDWRMKGRNGGVQLLHLERMRASSKYNAQLDRYGSGQAGNKLGYLGDQTLYTFLAYESPELFHSVGCEWNRQLSTHFGFGNASVHTCARPCGLMHANDGRYKCIAWRMQAEGATCDAWHGMVDRASLPRQKRPAGHESCLDLGAAHAPAWQQAMKRFFWDCCVPGASARRALGEAG